MEFPQITDLLDISHTTAHTLFKGARYPWEALDTLGEFITELGASLPEDEYDHLCGNIFIAKNAVIAPSAQIIGPCIIGKHTEIRHSAYIRGKAIIGNGCVIGNSCEIKNSIIFDEAKLPHFNYAGDSIIGHGAHMGASAIASNMKSDKSSISVRFLDKKIDTNRTKLGAILGDFAEIGCNTVLNPGCIISRNTTVYPQSCVRGFVEENMIVKNDGTTVKKHKGGRL